MANFDLTANIWPVRGRETSDRSFAEHETASYDPHWRQQTPALPYREPPKYTPPEPDPRDSHTWGGAATWAEAHDAWTADRPGLPTERVLRWMETSKREVEWRHAVQDFEDRRVREGRATLAELAQYGKRHGCLPDGRPYPTLADDAAAYAAARRQRAAFLEWLAADE